MHTGGGPPRRATGIHSGRRSPPQARQTLAPPTRGRWGPLPPPTLPMLREIEGFFDPLLLLVGAHKKARRAEEDGLRLPQPRALQDRHRLPLRGPRPSPGRSEGNCLDTTSGGYPQRTLKRLILLCQSRRPGSLACFLRRQGVRRLRLRRWVGLCTRRAEPAVEGAVRARPTEGRAARRRACPVLAFAPLAAPLGIARLAVAQHISGRLSAPQPPLE